MNSGAFDGSVSIGDVLATAAATLQAAHIPPEIREETLVRLAKTQLTTSRQQLVFNYKMAFESLRLPT
jgi:hypothetical protein